MNIVFRKISIIIVLTGIIQITCANAATPIHPETTSIQLAQKLSWLILTPSVLVYDLTDINRQDKNKIDMIVIDSQGRNATITIPKIAAVNVALQQGDDLKLTHDSTGSVLSKDNIPIIYLLNPLD